MLDHEILSGYLDGELSPEQTRAIEKALEDSAELRAALEQLMAADNLAKADFEAMLSEPVPLTLASAINKASPPEQSAANANHAPSGATPPASLTTSRRQFGGWAMASAATIALALTGAGGYFVGASRPARQTASIPGWLTEIGNYHRVYAAQGRHLVEVGADESDHIQKWLSNTVGAPVRIADLSSFDLEFRGARLLVAAGKPVAQLMYTDTDGEVVALCLIQTDAPQDGFQTREVGGYNMVTWGKGNANYVMVAEPDRDNLLAIATAAAALV